MAEEPESILWFEDIGISDVPIVGGKNASLGEMTRELAKSGVRVPSGFATTSRAYRRFIEASGIEAGIREEIRRYNEGGKNLQAAGSAVREKILSSPIPEALAGEIRNAYDELARRLDLRDPAVAVRSSATAEDLPDASFAGQQETFLNVRGHRAMPFTRRGAIEKFLKRFSAACVGQGVNAPAQWPCR